LPNLGRYLPVFRPVFPVFPKTGFFATYRYFFTNEKKNLDSYSVNLAIGAPRARADRGLASLTVKRPCARTSLHDVGLVRSIDAVVIRSLRAPRRTRAGRDVRSLATRGRRTSTSVSISIHQMPITLDPGLFPSQHQQEIVGCPWFLGTN
jgi:hypothetical protein